VLFELWPASYRLWLRWGGAFIILLLLVAFSLNVVFVPAPLNISAFATNAEPPKDAKIANIPWRSEYSELEVRIENFTARNYEDLDLVLQPNYPVAAIGQLSELDGVSFEDKYSVDSHLTLRKPGGDVAVPLIRVATDAGYRVRCPRLSAGGTLKIVMAVVDMKWNPAPPQNTEDFGVFTNDFLIRTQGTDETGATSTYWWGHQGGLVYAPRVLPTYLNFDGKYVAAQRKRTILGRKSIVNLAGPMH